MSRLPDSFSFSAVLRGATLSDEPRELLNPRVSRSGENQASLAAGQPSDGPPIQEATMAPNTRRDPREHGYREGFWQGQQEGLEQGMAQGRKQGFESGWSEGREAGAKEVLLQSLASQEAAALRIESLDQILTALSEQKDAQNAETVFAAEEDMIALCFSAVCRILGDQVPRREVVANCVRQAIEQCCGSKAHVSLSGLMAIHVHPGDLAMLCEDPELAAWFKQHGSIDDGDRGVTWVPDDRVRMGGCIVRSNQGSLDARIETQLGALQEILTQGRTQRSLPARGAEGSPSTRAQQNNRDGE